MDVLRTHPPYCTALGSTCRTRDPYLKVYLVQRCGRFESMSAEPAGKMSSVEKLEESSAEVFGEPPLEMLGGVNSLDNHKIEANQAVPSDSKPRNKQCSGFCSNKWDLLIFLVVSTVLLGLYLIPTIFFIIPPTYINSVSH